MLINGSAYYWQPNRLHMAYSSEQSQPHQSVAFALWHIRLVHAILWNQDVEYE